MRYFKKRVYENMQAVNWCDVQGLVLSGYPDLPHAAYLPWQFIADKTPEAKSWLRDLTQRLARADKSERGELNFSKASRHVANLKSLKILRQTHNGDIWAVNVALTASGMKALTGNAGTLEGFSTPFLEGMAPKLDLRQSTPRRCSILGDVEKNSPAAWKWGGWGANDLLDGMLFLYAKSASSLNRLIETELSQICGAQPLQSGEAPLVFRAQFFPDFREHFGFTDGVSQPIIEGTAQAKSKIGKDARISVVAPGEVLLGYENERREQAGGLHSSPNILQNGTYLVFRQLEQDVHAFRRCVAVTARRMFGKAAPEKQEWVAARLFGRWRNGDPLVSASSGNNEFLYYFEDRFGMACPLGAHIRRANPRDLIGPTPDTALRLSKMHRILRRGRPYGERLPDDASSKATDQRRGLMFICLNADIAGQFEFIQHSWLNNEHFSGLYHETDPISHYPAANRAMTIQHRPASVRVDSMRQFVTVKGGAYFFLPGIEALKLLTGV
jgi:Dyp-type peroxidase family